MLEDTGFPEQLIKIFKSPLESWHLPVEMRQNPTDFRERSIFRSFKLTTGDRAIHLAAFAWTTDVFLLYTANLAYPSRFPMGMGSATIATSINHSVWFHDPDAKIDEWMVNERRTSWGADGRVLIHQTVWNQETGRLVLTCIQEGFIRMKNGNL